MARYTTVEHPRLSLSYISWSGAHEVFIGLWRFFHACVHTHQPNTMCTLVFLPCYAPTTMTSLTPGGQTAFRLDGTHTHLQRNTHQSDRFALVSCHLTHASTRADASVAVTRWRLIWHTGCDASTGILGISRIPLCPGRTTINGVPWFLVSTPVWHLLSPFHFQISSLFHPNVP